MGLDNECGLCLGERRSTKGVFEEIDKRERKRSRSVGLDKWFVLSQYANAVTTCHSPVIGLGVRA